MRTEIAVDSNRQQMMLEEDRSGNKKVLFICQHNSGRSQIAEAYLKQFAGNALDIESAGLESGDSVNPLVVEVMKEEGIGGRVPRRTACAGPPDSGHDQRLVAEFAGGYVLLQNTGRIIKRN